jgi:hypothetical protein
MLFSRQLLVLCLAIAGISHAFADKTVAVDENWKVLLKDDGTWEFVTQDRFATGADGKRFKLNADGTWQAAGVASTQIQQRLRNNNSTFMLKEVVLEYAKTAANSTRKNSRTEMQTIFTLSVQLPQEHKKDSVSVTLDKSNVSVIDNRGKAYEILDIAPSTLSVDKANTQEVSIRVRESLRWGAKAMNLTINQDVFNSESDLVFIATPYDMVEKRVSGF